jgi:predicted DNA-binding transcriptional regulator AlpA
VNGVNPDQYVSAAEAARILGVTRQRVSTMVNDGDLPGTVYPWPRAVRIPLASIEAWKAGKRRIPVTRTAARAYVLAAEGAASAEWVSLPKIRKHTRAFIDERRPEWTPVARRAWAYEMADAIASHLLLCHSRLEGPHVEDVDAVQNLSDDLLAPAGEHRTAR